MGHAQLFLDKPHWRFRYNHGGVLRQKRRGRKARPLTTKDPIHLVFKANRKNLKRGFRSPLGFIITTRIIKKYSKRFFVKIEQAAICQDHIHLIIRLSRRSLGQHFLRVVSGQIAQEFQNQGMLVTDTPSYSSPSSTSPNSTFPNSSSPSTSVGARKPTKSLLKFSNEERKASTSTPDRATHSPKLWKYRPFTRVVKSFKAFKTLRSYVRLNHLESIKKISYRKAKLRGLLPHEYGLLWS